MDRNPFVVSFLITCSLSLSLHAQDKWLYLSNIGNTCPSYINIGDLDIPGNQITIEAKIISETEGSSCYHTPYPEAFDVVSKHYNREDVNYLLRANYAQITTTNGFFTTTSKKIEYNSCHHVALVYDGSYLKFYYDGCVYDSVPATGQLILNNWETKIGFYGSSPSGRSEQFFGYIDEVRMWNIARTKQEIRAYANKKPDDFTGLMAYYNFNDNYLNLQGNDSFNGVAAGNPALAFNNDTIAPIPSNFTVSESDNICEGESTELSVNGGSNSYYWYANNWSATGNNITIRPTVTTTYYVNEITNNNCYSRDSIIVNVHPKPVLSIQGDTVICLGDKVKLSASGATNYRWQGNGIASTFETIEFFPKETTIYSLTGTNNNCQSTLSHKITVLHNTNAFFDFSVDECNKKVSFNNLSTDGLSFEWTFGDGSTSDEVSPSHQYLTSGIYAVSLFINKNSACESSYHAEVSINSKEVIIPNVFTPNDDRYNNTFEIKGLSECDGTIRIFNRWGTPVFSSSMPSKEFWDGTYNGEKMASGCYFYYIKTHTKEYKGAVTLLR